MSLPGQCETCHHDEIDGEVCNNLTDCGILGGQCVRAEVELASEVQYPDIETKPKHGFRTTYEGRLAVPTAINQEIL